MKLNQLLPVEKQVKGHAKSEGDKLHKLAQKPELFIGMEKVFTPKDNDTEPRPPESQKVQQFAEEHLRQQIALFSATFNAEYDKDLANMSAKADIIVDGNKLFENAPATFLLWMEKQLEDLRTMVSILPTLAVDKDWKRDPSNSDLHRTEPQRTTSSKKVPKVLVKYDATDKHPAQTEVYQEDVVVGYWDTTHLSGSLPVDRKKLILLRIEKLLAAVKVAREEANSMKVTQTDVGKVLLDWVIA